MKRIIASSVLASFTFLPFLVNAEDISLPAKMEAEVKVEIRKGATTSYPLVTTLNQGQLVTIVDEHTNTSGETWYRVNLGNVQGWGLARSFVETNSNFAIGQVVVVSGDNVNVRKGATTSYPSISKLTRGTKVTIIDQFKNNSGENWAKVEIGTIRGWVLEDFLSSTTSTVAKPPTPTALEQKIVQIEQAQVKKGASQSYATVASLVKNQRVSVIDSFKNSLGEQWYRIDLGTVQGWVIGTAFEAAVVNPPTPTPSTVTPSIGAIVYSTGGTIVRRGATTSYASVAVLAQNQEVKIADIFTHATGDQWYRVAVNSSVSGWVPSSGVTTEKSLDLTLYVNVDSANLRSGPSTSNSIISKASKGTRLQAFNSTKDSSGDTWYQATTANNQTVWVHESVVSTQSTATIGSTMYIGTYNTNLYSGASTNYKVKQKLPFMSKVTVISEFVNSVNQTWLQVKTPAGVTGWALKKDIVVSQADLKYVYALNKAVVRKGASTSYLVTSNLKENDSLLVLGSHNNWLNVETPGGVRGWIDQSLTSSISLKRLVTPTIEGTLTEQYLTWKKTIDFSFSYSTLTDSRLKLTGGITDIEIPSTNPVGIKSIETFTSGTEKSVVISFLPGYTFTLRNYSDRVVLKVIESGLKGKRIIIDPGHGGKDPGAIGPNGLKEKDVVLNTSLLLKAELEKYGAIVTLTRSTDIFLELSDRTTISNANNYDAFISLHTDAFSTTTNGTTTFYNTTVNFNGPRSRDLGNNIHTQLISALGTYNRGVKEQEFYVNRMNEIPSVLVELAFISNPNEEALLRTQEFRQQAATGIRKGLEQYFTSF